MFTIRKSFSLRTGVDTCGAYKHPAKRQGPLRAGNRVRKPTAAGGRFETAWTGPRLATAEANLLASSGDSGTATARENNQATDPFVLPLFILICAAEMKAPAPAATRRERSDAVQSSRRLPCGVDKRRIRGAANYSKY